MYFGYTLHSILEASMGMLDKQYQVPILVKIRFIKQTKDGTIYEMNVTYKIYVIFLTYVMFKVMEEISSTLKYQVL